jgi:hypothetical protein
MLMGVGYCLFIGDARVGDDSELLSVMDDVIVEEVGFLGVRLQYEHVTHTGVVRLLGGGHGISFLFVDNLLLDVTSFQYRYTSQPKYPDVLWLKIIACCPKCKYSSAGILRLA